MQAQAAAASVGSSASPQQTALTGALLNTSSPAELIAALSGLSNDPSAQKLAQMLASTPTVSAVKSLFSGATDQAQAAKVESALDAWAKDPNATTWQAVQTEVE